MNYAPSLILYETRLHLQSCTGGDDKSMQNTRLKLVSEQNGRLVKSFDPNS